MRRLAVLCTLLSAAACGGDDHSDPLELIDGGPEPDGTPGDPFADGPVNTDGPVVEVTSPTAPPSGDFGADEIVVEDRFVATCRVEANDDTGDPVDSTSVMLTAIAGEDSYQVPAVPSGAANEYEATLDVSDFGNGPLTIRCTASDLAGDPRTNSDEVGTFLDLGPSIEFLSPTPNASYGQQVDLSFVVLPDPVDDDDDLADIDTVTVRVGGVEVDATPTGGGSYFATILFKSNLFNPSLDGDVAIRVDATNDRGVTRSDALEFTADSDGPVIDIESPEAGELVSGFLEIIVTVTDPAGIDSVVATLAQDFEVELIPDDGDTYTGTIDTRQLSTNMVFPLLSVRARDSVGNEAAQGRVVALDHRAPLISMDSPRVRDAICYTEDECDVEADDLECSRAFDPLGSDSANDADLVGQLIELRVRTEDIGNGAIAPTGVVIPLAGVDEADVKMYVLDNTGMALLVDSDDDPFCDELNPALVPTTVPDAANEMAVVTLAPIDPEGEAFFAATISPPAVGSDPAVADDQCVPAADPDTEAPTNLCATVSLSEAISTPYDEPAIYTIPPVEDPQCGGNAFDAVATNIADGWACVVTVAVDKLGNVGVSAPLRICIDSDNDGTDGNGMDLHDDLGCGENYGDPGLTPPDCTDGCQLPLTFEDIPTKQIRVLETKQPVAP